MKWNDFQQNIVSSYQDLRKEFDFSDVTLVCEDEYQVEAHRIILTACSPFFKTIMKNNKHSHPMVYMRGLKAKDLVAILDYIYHGEANINKDDLDGFLALADELQLKGLVGCKNNTIELSEENDMEGIAEEPIKKELLEEDVEGETLTRSKSKQTKSVRKVMEYCKESKDITHELTVPDAEDFLGNTNMKDIKARTGLFMEKAIEGNYKWKCTVCGKMSKYRQDMSRHIETHIQGVSYPCKLCGAVKRTSMGLVKHVQQTHKN